MDNAVALVEANLRINGYFTVAEDPIKESLQRRLNRIEGQVRGIDRMIDEARYCIDIHGQGEKVDDKEKLRLTACVANNRIAADIAAGGGCKGR